VTELRTSEDGGRTFSAPSVVEGIDAKSGCPLVGAAPSGAIYLSWMRNDDFDLMVSRARPKRPCE
jgi:hypothetical protein